MDKKSVVGSSAGLFALIAVLAHMLGGGGSEQDKGQKEPQAMPDLSAFAAHSETQELSLVRQGPWNAAQQFFHRDSSVSSDVLSKCLQQPDQSCVQFFVDALYAFAT